MKFVRSLSMSLSAFGVSLACMGTTAMAVTKQQLPPLDASVCTSLGGSWSNSTCEIRTNQAPGERIEFQIRKGTTLLIDAGASLQMNNGFDTIMNYGTITNEGAFGGYMNIPNYGIVNNQGTFSLYNGNPLSTNTGLIENHGTFIMPVASDQTLNNKGTINNYVGAMLTLPATATTVVNVSNTGTINNYGTLDNHGLLQNQKRIVNNCGGVISNSGTGTITGKAVINTPCN